MNEIIHGEKNSTENLKNKTLLILTPAYPNKDDSFIMDTFVKYQVDELRQYFNKVIVIAPVFGFFKCFKRDQLCIDYSYDNVDVYYPRCVYIPVFWMSKILIDNRFQAVERVIKHHNLNFDLIHAHFTWPSGYIGVLLKKKYRCPIILTIHESGEWFDQEVKMHHALINAAWTEADALIRVNQKDVPILNHYNNCVFSIPNGYSTSFHPTDIALTRKELGLSADKKIIFSLGDLIKRKGFKYLIDAMEKVCNQRDDVLCFIGGAGSDMKNLQERIDRLHLGDKIRLLGPVPANRLNFWMNASNFFVLSSLSEGNPTVMFESLGCGKPFIGTRVGGVPEVISSEDYGLLVEPANAGDLADKIMIALNREWSQEKILTYAERFTWENITKEIIEIYKQFLK
jgi:teichuronic acid biosynthesis glycosyltransferase TuaC